MSEIQPFTFPTTGQAVRTLLVDGDPWFVAADVCTALGYSRIADALRIPDSDDLATHFVGGDDGLERPGQILNEAALYSLILRSNRPDAKKFKRWVTHDVLPSIRKTGSYSVATFGIPTSFAEALELAARQQRELEAAKVQVAAAEHQILELAPAAHAWDTLASAADDYDVATAAKILSRDPAIKTGRTRLFTYLANQGWIYRTGGHWAPYQRHVDNGRLLVLPSSHYHPRTGELVLDPPQVRITVKGIGVLHNFLGGTAAVADLLGEPVSA